MYGYVYRISHPTGYYYIGRHISNVIDTRYKGSGCALKNAMRRYHRSEWNIEVLAIAETLCELNKLEADLIGDLYKTDSYCLNRRRGGLNGSRHTKTAIQHMKDAFERTRKDRSFKFHQNFSEKGIQFLRSSHTGKNNPMYGKHGVNHPSAVPVYCVELNTQFESIADAESATGIQRQNICKVCKGLRTTTGGYHWRYVVE